MVAALDSSSKRTEPGMSIRLATVSSQLITLPKGRARFPKCGQEVSVDLMGQVGREGLSL